LDASTSTDTHVEPDAGVGDDSSDAGNTLPGDVIRLNLELQLSSTSADVVTDWASSWFLNVEVGDDSWLAFTGGRSGDANATVWRSTAGSSSAHATRVDSTITLDPVTVQISSNQAVDFTAFELTVAGDGSVSGSASGTWRSFGGDFIQQEDFAAQIAGGSDTEPPIVASVDGDEFYPFEPVQLTFSEPVLISSIDVTASAGEPLGMTFEYANDGRPGFAKSVTLRTVGGWPAGKSVEIAVNTADDAAGNRSNQGSLGQLTIPNVLDSNANLGFESGTSGWVNLSVVGEQPLTKSSQPELMTTVTPTEGSAMAFVTGRAIGYLVAPVGATRLCFDAGVVTSDFDNFETFDGGLDVGVYRGQPGQVLPFTGSAFAPYADVDLGWSGFKNLCVGLPDQSDQGVWLSLTPVGQAPPAFFPPDVYVDNLTLQ
jgi:hypothetical protein